MNTQKAIELLESFQKQIIHGSNTFQEISNVIKQLEKRLYDSEQLLSRCRNIQGIPYELYEDIQEFL